MKLWKGDVRKDVEEFLASDISYDEKLVKYEILNTVAHAHMLKKIGFFDESEVETVKKAAKEILDLAKKGEFKLTPEDEDIHTKIISYLIEHYGEVGKKIHLGRSRNDLIISTLRLYLKEKVLELLTEATNLCKILLDLAEENKNVPMPGYTHTRKAMPSSVGLWFASFAEALLDDLKLLKVAYEFINQCPLGAAAGYGTPICVDRQHLADLLGYERVQRNVLYVHNSRGKYESIVLFALYQLMADLARMSNDVIFFTSDELEYFIISDNICTGSSIMPVKKNPDIFELMRAKAAEIFSATICVCDILRPLISGYSRDLQETKVIVMEAIELVIQCLKVFKVGIKNLKPNKEKLIKASKDPKLLAVDAAYELVKKGMSYREAYLKIAESRKVEVSKSPEEIIKERKNIGEPGNLMLDEIRKDIEEIDKWCLQEKKKFENVVKKLLN